MKEWWQLNDCPCCGGRHPRACSDCPGGPPCAGHVCAWPEADDEE